MKKVLSAIAIVAASAAFAQVGISGDTNDTPEATLDVKAIGTANGNTTPDGILVPRVSRQAARDMQGTIQESTLIYVDNISDGDQTGIAVNIDAVGFYYYMSGTTNAWVKLGGGATSAQPEKTIRVVAAITESEWDNNQYALAQTSNADIVLPDPATNVNRIISVNNQYTNNLNYNPISPANTSSIRSGKGQLLMSNGTAWYIIGGY